MALLDEFQLSEIRSLIRENTPVLICPKDTEAAQQLRSFVHSLGGIALMPQAPYTWKELFRLAFSRRAAVVIGEPRIILGLYKLVRAYRVALKIKFAVVLSDKRDAWMCEDIAHGLDCRVYTVSAKESIAADDTAMLERELLSWTSILDCQISVGESGLELKVVYFSGERLPKLPSCAKLQLTPWNQNEDGPFCLNSLGKNG